ncbi:MAG: hypothetical protein HYY09_05245 [Firmicutes bacterium]|nr:hypothetical protein [Bacillota bacterium]
MLEQAKRAVGSFVDQLSKDLARLEERSNQLSRELVQVTRSQQQLQKMLSDKEERLTSLEEHLQETFRETLSQPEVRSLDWKDEALVVETTPVILLDASSGRRHLVGPMRVTISLDGGIVINNLENTGARPYWDHPHVQNGLPCLGNLKPGLLKLIGQLELSLAVRLLLDFLAVYDPETAYGPLDLWQEAKP